MNIYVDIDNTITKTTGMDYEKAVPLMERINVINKLLKWRYKMYNSMSSHYCKILGRNVGFMIVKTDDNKIYPYCTKSKECGIIIHEPFPENNDFSKCPVWGKLKTI